MNIRTPLAAFVLAITGITAFAQAPAGTPGVDAREAKQDARIDQGVASGQLTARETRRLEREQKHIAKVEAHAKADGKVTVAERARLHRAQNAASRDIARQKHDAQTAVGK
jgi:hypothetical protein